MVKYEIEKYTVTKTNCFFVPAGVVHGLYTFRNVTSRYRQYHFQ